MNEAFRSLGGGPMLLVQHRGRLYANTQQRMSKDLFCCVLPNDDPLARRILQPRR